MSEPKKCDFCDEECIPDLCIKIIHPLFKFDEINREMYKCGEAAMTKCRHCQAKQVEDMEELKMLRNKFKRLKRKSTNGQESSKSVK